MSPLYRVRSSGATALCRPRRSPRPPPWRRRWRRTRRIRPWTSSRQAFFRCLLPLLFALPRCAQKAAPRSSSQPNVYQKTWTKQSCAASAALPLRTSTCRGLMALACQYPEKAAEPALRALTSAWMYLREQHRALKAELRALVPDIHAVVDRAHQASSLGCPGNDATVASSPPPALAAAPCAVCLVGNLSPLLKSAAAIVRVPAFGAAARRGALRGSARPHVSACSVPGLARGRPARRADRLAVKRPRHSWPLINCRPQEVFSEMMITQPMHGRG